MVVPLQLTYIVDKTPEASNEDILLAIEKDEAVKESAVVATVPIQVQIDAPTCELCFEIPNRAKLSSHVRHHGIPDSSVQKVVGSLTVICPFSIASCPWIGQRDLLPGHLANECVVPKGGNQANIPPVSDFALDEKWAYSSNKARSSKRLSVASDSSRDSSLPGNLQPAQPLSARSSLFFSRRLSAVGSTTGLITQTEESEIQANIDGSETGSEAERAMERENREANNTTPLWEQVQGYVMSPEESAERAQRRQFGEARQRQDGNVEAGAINDDDLPLFFRKRLLLALGMIVCILIILALVGLML
ncbi:UNVERIFIED_CONTAM: hypothetical protein HDU68_008592 [Siphonaria sp. JEL0065]|nr:hypothetical protein HDU68_008592 [Siphonaria sp. JEL0065]